MLCSEASLERHPESIQLSSPCCSWPFQARDRLPPSQYCRPTGTMSMNIFRLCGDMSHVFSIIVLLLRLRVAKNASGELVGYPAAICVCVCVCVCVRLTLSGPQPQTLEMRYSSLNGDEVLVLVWASLFPAAAEKPCQQLHWHGR